VVQSVTLLNCACSGVVADIDSAERARRTVVAESVKSCYAALIEAE
jgi:hypothetical protein